MPDDFLSNYPVLFEGKNPNAGNKRLLFMASEPDAVRIVDISTDIQDGRHSTVMVLGFVEEKGEWVANHGERLALKLLLEENAALKARGLQLQREIEELEKENDQLSQSFN